MTNADSSISSDLVRGTLGKREAAMHEAAIDMAFRPTPDDIIKLWSPFPLRVNPKKPWPIQAHEAEGGDGK